MTGPTGTRGTALLRRPRAVEPDWRLLAIPHAGAGASALGGWIAAAPAECEIVVLRLPGRESRYSEPPAADAAALALDLSFAVAPLLDRPYAVFGYSMGALIGYELVRVLLAQDRRPPVLLAVGGMEAPHVARHVPPMHDLPGPEFAAALRQLGGTPDLVFETPELWAVLEPALRADMRLVETYDHEPGPPLPVPVGTYCGSSDDDLDADGVRAWQDITAVGARHRTFPGGHFFADAAGAPILPAVLADVANARAARR